MEWALFPAFEGLGLGFLHVVCRATDRRTGPPHPPRPVSHRQLCWGCSEHWGGVALIFYRKFVVWVFLSLAHRPRIFEPLDLIHPVETVQRQRDAVRIYPKKQSAPCQRRVPPASRQPPVPRNIPDLDWRRELCLSLTSASAQGPRRRDELP